MKSHSIAHADPLAPGLRIGRYELIRRLAVGGMAEIYLARATGIEGFEKLVVLKRILPQFATNGGFISMFLDEARLTATLQHPNIAQVYDIGEFGGSYFFTMEFVRGADVRSMLKTALIYGEPIPLAHVITIILGVTAGLHAAHEKRGLDGTPLDVVHRDVSPSNVLVSYDGAVKLVDFGIAKASQHRNRTQAGTLKGKAAYMSPEQCTGRPLDRRSDIFAIGILLYELACCRRLFVGESEFEIMSKIVNQDVTPPSDDDPDFPEELERILLRALKRNPDERYPTAKAMQLDLEEFARHEKLAVSTVKLGEFMQQMFADRMREQEELIAQQIRTGELALGESSDGGAGAEEDDDEVDFEIEADAAADLSDRALAVVYTAMFAAEDSAAISFAGVPTGAGNRSRARREEPASVSELRDGARAQQHPAARRQWPWALVGAATAACAIYVLGEQRDTKAEQREVRATVEAPVRRAAKEVGVESPARALTSSVGEPKAGATDEAPAPAVEPRARTSDEASAPGLQAGADEEAGRPAGEAEPGASPASIRVEARAAQHRRERAKRHRAHAPRAKPPRKKPADARPASPAVADAWSLDSPLPPPGKE